MSSYVVHALISISVREVTELLERRWLSPVLWQPPASSLTQCAHLLNGPWEVLVHCLSCSSPSTCVEADIQRRLKVWEKFTLWPKLWNTVSVAGALGKHPLLSECLLCICGSSFMRVGVILGYVCRVLHNSLSMDSKVFGRTISWLMFSSSVLSS